MLMQKAGAFAQGFDVRCHVHPPHCSQEAPAPCDSLRLAEAAEAEAEAEAACCLGTAPASETCSAQRGNGSSRCAPWPEECKGLASSAPRGSLPQSPRSVPPPAEPRFQAASTANPPREPSCSSPQKSSTPCNRGPPGSANPRQRPTVSRCRLAPATDHSRRNIPP